MSLLFDMDSRLALGTVQFGLNYGVANKHGQVSFDDAKSILELAKDNGIDTLDTAIVYGDSEQRLGEIGINGWNVVSKLPATPDDCGDIYSWVVSSVQQSLKRLGQKSIYGLLLHKPEQLYQPGGDRIYLALQKLKKDGLIHKFGASIYSPDELDLLEHNFKLDIIQAPFNIFDRRLTKSGWLAKLHNQGVEIHVRSIFLQGLLLMPSSERPNKFNKWHSLWNIWDTWLKDSDITPLQACTQYVLSFKEIQKVVVGVDNIQQLADIVHASKGELPFIPENICCADNDLVNPSRWSAL